MSSDHTEENKTVSVEDTQISAPPPSSTTAEGTSEEASAAVATKAEEVVTGASKSAAKQKVKTFTREEVRKHCTVDDCWVIIGRKVYAFDSVFLFQGHPGGSIILDAAGKDGSILFEDHHHSPYAEEALNEFFIGKLAPS